MSVIEAIQLGIFDNYWNNIKNIENIIPNLNDQLIIYKRSNEEEKKLIKRNLKNKIIIECIYKCMKDKYTIPEQLNNCNYPFIVYYENDRMIIYLDDNITVDEYTQLLTNDQKTSIIKHLIKNGYNCPYNKYFELDSNIIKDILENVYDFKVKNENDMYLLRWFMCSKNDLMKLIYDYCRNNDNYFTI